MFSFNQFIVEQSLRYKYDPSLGRSVPYDATPPSDPIPLSSADTTTTPPSAEASTSKGVKGSKIGRAAMPSGIPSFKDLGKAGVGFGTGVGGVLAYDALMPANVRDYIRDKEVTIGKTKLNADDLGQFGAFELGAAIPQMFFDRSVKAPLSRIPGNVVGGMVGWQKGANLGKKYAERLGIGETGQTVAEYTGGILGYGGGASVANSLLRLKNPAAKTVLGKSLGVAGVGLGLADTGMEEWEKAKSGEFEGWGKVAGNILDPGDLLYLSAGPVIGPAALVGSKAFKLGSAISRDYYAKRQKETSDTSNRLTDATLVLNDDEYWKNYTPESKEAYRKYVDELESFSQTNPRAISGERAAVQAANKESMKDLIAKKDTSGNIIGYQSSAAEQLKKQAEEAARKRGFQTADEIDKELKSKQQNEEVKVQKRIKNLLEQINYKLRS